MLGVVIGFARAGRVIAKIILGARDNNEALGIERSLVCDRLFPIFSNLTSTISSEDLMV